MARTPDEGASLSSDEPALHESPEPAPSRVSHIIDQNDRAHLTESSAPRSWVRTRAGWEARQRLAGELSSQLADLPPLVLGCVLARSILRSLPLIDPLVPNEK